MGATAYATGNQVAFASTPDLHTAAHEAAHIVQQRTGVSLMGGVGEAGDPYERHADLVADAAVAGRSAEALLDQAPGGGGGAVAAIQKQEAPGAAEAASVTQQVIEALNTPDPIAGVGDFVTAYNLLNGLSLPSMLRVLDTLAAQFMLDVLLSGQGQARGVNMPRISAAIALVRLAHTNASSIQQTELEAFATNAQTLPADQQRDMLDFATTARRMGAATREGLVAMMASELGGATPGGLSPAVAQGVTGPVGPSPWNPPGGQPIPFYIGNEAHVGIAASYTAAHPGDPVFTNFIPLSTILREATTLGLTPNAGALSASDLALKPDILNLAPTRRHLFEIKPTNLQGQARAEAQMYVGLLATAGVPVTLGPVGEPGTNGAIPAPGGVYLFETPEPGVIVYQYRRQRLIEEPVPVGEQEPARERRFRLAPLTPQQQAVVATTFAAGVLLIIMMILLAPVGA